MNELWNRLLSTWDTLNPRERIFVSVTGGLLITILLTVGVIQPILESVGDHEAIADAEQRVETMRRLRSTTPSSSSVDEKGGMDPGVIPPMSA